MGVGHKLKEILKNKNITIAELSRKSFISAQTLYSIINRDSGLSFENAIKIAKILDIDYLELVDTENDTYNRLLKQERDEDDYRKYGYAANHTFDESINYFLDSHTKLTSGILNMFLHSYQYEIKYINNSFYLTKGNTKLPITRDSLDNIYTQTEKFVKKMVDNIANNELSNNNS